MTPRIFGHARRYGSALLLAVGLSASALAGCSTMQNAAQQDPMKCERDPKCEKKRTRANDCTAQCVDDPACVERCQQVQAPSGQLGH